MLQPHKPCAGFSLEVVQDTSRMLCQWVRRLKIGLLASALQSQVYTERCVACLGSTSLPCACWTWPELGAPPPRWRSVATCGRSHLCFRGAQASGRVLTSVRRTWLGASELQPNKYIPHTPHASASSLSQLGALPACVKPTRDITAMTVCTCLWHPSSPALGHQVPVTNSHLIVVKCFYLRRIHHLLIMDMLGDTLDNVDRGCVYQR